MCGIIGFVGQVREGRMAANARPADRTILQSLTRGRDATGFAAVASRLMNRNATA